MYSAAAAAQDFIPLHQATRDLLVLVAHPDDETGGCAGLLQRVARATVVYATDAAPADPFFWNCCGSREQYARMRRDEAAAALSAAGVRDVGFLCDYAPGETCFADQRLHLALGQAWSALHIIVRWRRPGALLVPAYEGGHPDHDCCSFLGSLVRRYFGLPVWEMPLYHRSAGGQLVCRRFRDPDLGEALLRLSQEELRVREMMVACYRSQRDLADYVFGTEERFRPQAAYDYSRPPHPGTLNYEAWQWPISAADVSRQFVECAAGVATGESEAAPLPGRGTLPATAAGLHHANSAT